MVGGHVEVGAGISARNPARVPKSLSRFKHVGRERPTNAMARRADVIPGRRGHVSPQHDAEWWGVMSRWGREFQPEIQRACQNPCRGSSMSAGNARLMPWRDVPMSFQGAGGMSPLSMTQNGGGSCRGGGGNFSPKSSARAKILVEVQACRQGTPD